MKPALCLVLSLVCCVRMAAYEWTGRSPDLNGVTIAAVVDGQAIIVFGENAKLYSNVLAKAGCHFGKLNEFATGSGDAEHHYTYTSIIAHDHTGSAVTFDIVLVHHQKDGTYGIRKLARREDRP